MNAVPEGTPSPFSKVAGSTPYETTTAGAIDTDSMLPSSPEGIAGSCPPARAAAARARPASKPKVTTPPETTAYFGAGVPAGRSATTGAARPAAAPAAAASGSGLKRDR